MLCCAVSVSCCWVWKEKEKPHHRFTTEYSGLPRVGKPGVTGGVGKQGGGLGLGLCLMGQQPVSQAARLVVV